MLADTTGTKSDNYAYVYNITSEEKANSDGFVTDIYTAYMVKADGTKASYVIDSDDITDAGKDTAKFGGTAIKGFGGKLIAYSINSDNELEIATAKDTLNAMGNGVTVDKNSAAITKDKNTIYATSSTQFIFTNIKDTKAEVSTATGYKNVSIASGSWVTAVSDEDGYALYVFVRAANGTLSSDTKYAVILDTTPVKTEDDDNNEFYTYSVAIGDDNDATLTWKNKDQLAEVKDLAKGDVISYTMDGEYVKDTTITKETFQAAAAANDDYITVDGKQYNLGTETVYTITKEYKKDGVTLDTVSVTEGGTIEKDDKVVITLDNGDLDLVFVIEEIK